MATKLKNLKVSKVDFVDEGANPDAHIKLFKRNDTGTSQSTERNSEKGTGIFKKLFSFIGKAAGMDQDEIDGAIEEIQKSDSVSFKEKINEVKNRKIADEIWDTCYALQSSLCSILNDEEMDSTNAATAMQESLDDFCTVVQDCITQWSAGKESSIVRKNEEVTEVDLAVMKSAVERLTGTIENASVQKKGPEANNEEPKGEQEMKIDKSKLSDAERAFLDSIEKRYGVEEGAPQPAAPVVPEAPVTKSVAQPETQPAVVQTSTEDNSSDDIYKGLNSAVKAELENLKKFREEAEERELGQVASKYEIIGKKKEELVPVLKSLKAAGGTAYSDMIAILDQTVETVEKSGAFSEIGKAGHDANGGASVEAKVDTIAKSFMEKDPSLDYNMAVAKAWENNPELLDEYDEKAGF